MPAHLKTACVRSALLAVPCGVLYRAETFVLDFFTLPWVPLTWQNTAAAALVVGLSLPGDPGAVEKASVRGGEQASAELG